MRYFIISLRASIVTILVFTLLLGFVYPLVVTALSQLLFPTHASGSLIRQEDKIMGSVLLGQHFDKPNYFWGRLSATTPPYNAAASGGSNLSPANPKLMQAASARIAALKAADPGNRAPIPVELVTASASGLDPHISIAAASYQLPRVARARNMKEEELRALVEKHTETPGFGLLGDPYVNVLKLNLALDERK